MSTNVEEVKQLFKNAQDAQDQYFDSVIRLIERLELKIKVLERQLAKINE